MQHATGSEREGKTLEGTGNPILDIDFILFIEQSKIEFFVLNKVLLL